MTEYRSEDFARCAWCHDPACTRPLTDWPYPPLPPNTGTRRCVFTAPPAAISAWTVCEEERAGWTR